MTKYNFEARGKTPDGNTFKATGVITGPDPDKGRFPPHSVFEAARAEVEKCFPGCTLEGDRPAIEGVQYACKTFPTVWQVKK